MKKWQDWYFNFLVALGILALVLLVTLSPSGSYLEAVRSWGF